MATSPAQNRPIMNSASGPLSHSPGLFAGYSIRETDGARAVVRFRDGDDTSDPRNILMTISLSPLESARDWFLPDGIDYQYSLYCEIVSGQIEGSALIKRGAR